MTNTHTPLSTPVATAVGVGSSRGAGRPSRETILRMSGAALALGGPLCVAGGTLHPIVDGKGHSVAALTGPGTPAAQLLIGAGTMLLVLGLPGMYYWLRPRLGVAGFVGVVCYLLGNVTTGIGHLTLEVFVAHPLASDPETAHLIADNDNMVDGVGFAVFNHGGGAIMLLGMAMLGASMLRHHAVPRWIAVLTLIGMVGFFLPLPAVQHITGFYWEAPRGIAVAAIGILMIRRPDALRQNTALRQDTALRQNAALRQDAAPPRPTAR